MNAIDLLIQDHKVVKKLLEELSSTTERAVKKRAELLPAVKQPHAVNPALAGALFAYKILAAQYLKLSTGLNIAGKIDTILK